MESLIRLALEILSYNDWQLVRIMLDAAVAPVIN